LIIKIQEYFQFRPCWYCGSEVRALVLQYYFVLRSVLRAKPCLRRCLTRCRHCRIFFLTHPRNAGRDDLGCPFGCKAAHSKRSSTNRSVEYYLTDEGKSKKRIQNSKRKNHAAKAELANKQKAAALNQRSVGADMVSYLQMVIGLIEGRRMGRSEILEMVARVVRQRSMERRRRIDYILHYLNERAP
jgi:hypothetical protein